MKSTGDKTLGERIRGVEQEKEHGLEVDTQEDLDLAKFYMSKDI